MKTRLLLLCLSVLGFAAGCDWDPLHHSGAPLVTAGEDGALPAVTDFRRSGTCPGSLAFFTLRFSKPMNRANVENAASFSEILGDIRGATQPKLKAAVLPDPKTFVWEDDERQVSFSAILIADRMYTLNLALTVTDRTGKGLDGEVGSDVDGDGAIDITMDDGQYARIDDDYLRKPVDFTSLPFFVCDSGAASGIWRVPLNDSRPRVLEMAGLIPNNESLARYLPATGYFPFGTTDGALVVEKPLPIKGVLRLQIGTPNTAPTRGFAQQNNAVPALPSTLTGNLEVSDADERDFKARIYLDDRTTVLAPLVGNVKSASANSMEADVLNGLNKDILAGMQLVAQGNNGYVFALPITGNTGNKLWVEPVFFRETRAVRPEPINTLFFPSATFRENETQGLKFYRTAEDGSVFGGALIAEGNTANSVRIASGDTGSLCPVSSLSAPNPIFCIYRMDVDLDKMGFVGKSFEVVPPHVYLHTGVSRQKGQILKVRLNFGETPITDIYGRPFVDGLADGNDRGEVDDQWIGSFSNGDINTQPIPPTLQLNDGRWYSIFPNGSSVGSTIALPPHGTYTYLGAGIMGRYEAVCQDFVATPVLTDLSMVFATPDGADGAIGADDLLWMATVNATNFSAYRMNGLQPESIPTSVTGTTLHRDIYKAGALLKRIPLTFVRLSPAPEMSTVTVAGNDGLCSTADDQVKNKSRTWLPGDRVLISHRVLHPKGDENSLDGNYDGVLEESARDDVIAEYQPATATPFRQIP